MSALAEIRRRYQTDSSGLMNQEYIDPEVVTSPQEAFYADKESVPLEDSVGKVCSEFVMSLPPGNPHPGPRRADYQGNPGVHPVCQGQGLLYDGHRGPGH